METEDKVLYEVVDMNGSASADVGLVTMDT